VCARSAWTPRGRTYVFARWLALMTTEQPRVIPDLLQDLSRLGLQAGDAVVMHSSFKALGRKDIAPADFIRTLLEAIGPDGTLMAPTFTYSYSGFWNAQPFEPDRPGLDNGILTETLRHYPGARRSAHPTYSVAAAGQHAETLTQDKASASALGFGSSYDVAHHLGARILLLGVGNDRNSMLHFAESVAGLPYLDIPWRAFAGKTALVLKDGCPVEVPLPEEYPGCSLGFGVVDDYLDAQGLLRRGRVGSADCLLLDSGPTVAAVVERLKREPDWILCHTFGCEPCTLRRRRLRELGLL
jgi:aminoglycoside 3-N-acetyltransferase